MSSDFLLIINFNDIFLISQLLVKKNNLENKIVVVPGKVEEV